MLTPTQRGELRRHARAILRGWIVPPRKAFRALQIIGLVSDEDRDVLTSAGWAAVVPLLTGEDAERAALLAAGDRRLRHCVCPPHLQARDVGSAGGPQ